MKNLLKLALLLSVFAIGGINATQIQVDGQYIVIPDGITLVNDLDVNANVAGRVYAPGSRYKLDEATLRRLGGSIKVQKPNGEVGYITYQTIPAGYQGLQMESEDFETKNLSDAFALEAR